ncbi:MAG: hypothetical protein CMK32_00610 [Porticoccaceae bacterium]|nr:hypothetical protein [Porticoccaceae bacterium]
MTALSRKDLLSLEDYARQRNSFRERVMAHKQHRQVVLGEHLRLLFEDRLTIQYQVQEMLRAERIFEAEGIEEELAAYNPLIPDGDNWKATMMIEYAEVDKRRQALSELVGIEDLIWVQIGNEDRIFAIADEDLERSTEDKTSSVHFLRFPLTGAAIAAANSGADITFGVEHPQYREKLTVAETVRTALCQDLTSGH